MRHHIGPEQVARIVCPVEQKMEHNVRVLCHQPNQGFVAEAANAFKVSAGQQKTGIDGNVHVQGEGSRAQKNVMLSLPKHIYRVTNPIVWVC